MVLRIRTTDIPLLHALLNMDLINIYTSSYAMATHIFFPLDMALDFNSPQSDNDFVIHSPIGPILAGSLCKSRSGYFTVEPPHTVECKSLGRRFLAADSVGGAQQPTIHVHKRGSFQRAVVSMKALLPIDNLWSSKSTGMYAPPVHRVYFHRLALFGLSCKRQAKGAKHDTFFTIVENPPST